jgi:hypothetical protein
MPLLRLQRQLSVLLRMRLQQQLSFLLRMRRQLQVCCTLLHGLQLQLLCMCAGNKLAHRHEGHADMACAKAQDVLSTQDIMVVLRLQPQAAAAARRTQPSAVAAAEVCSNADAATGRDLCSRTR